MAAVLLGAVCLLSLLVFLYSWVQYSYSESMRYLRALPTGLPTLPLLGHLHYIIFSGEGLQTAALSLLRRISKQQLRIFCIWFGQGPIVFINDPVDVQVVLNKSNTLDKSQLYKLLNFCVGDGLVTAPGMIFGPKLEGDIDPSALIKIKKAAILSAHLTGARAVKPWLRWDTIFNLLYNKQVQNEINNMMYSLPVSVIEEIEEFESPLKLTSFNSNVKQQSHVPVENKKPLTLPEIYKTIRAEHLPMKKRDLLMEINTLLLAGTDTVSVTLSNCLLALATYPDIQTKVYNEIIKEVGDTVQLLVTSKDLTNLEYMDCVLKETLRWLPVAPFFAKINKYDIKLGDYTFPANTNIAINVLGMHSNPRLFPDPDRFDSDRFRAENAAQRHKYSFLPFSGGVRDCIGKRYAWLLMKILLVHLLREYKVNTITDIKRLKFSFEIIMTPKKPHTFSFEKRQ